MRNAMKLCGTGNRPLYHILYDIDKVKKVDDGAVASVPNKVGMGAPSTSTSGNSITQPAAESNTKNEETVKSVNMGQGTVPCPKHFIVRAKRVTKIRHSSFVIRNYDEKSQSTFNRAYILQNIKEEALSTNYHFSKAVSVDKTSSTYKIADLVSLVKNFDNE